MLAIRRARDIREESFVRFSSPLNLKSLRFNKEQRKRGENCDIRKLKDWFQISYF